MGGLISLLHSDSSKAVAIVLDFDAKPTTEAEAAVHAEVGQILSKGPGILAALEKYPGCEEHIRKAITTPCPENEAAAWEAVLPGVDQLKEFYDFSLELETCFPKLLLALCKEAPKESLCTQQALAKQLADVFDFVLRFDDAKMVNPAIQNDFSYYRRTLNRMKLSKTDMNIKIRDELANRMSLFFAYPTPMMNSLSETTVKFLTEQSDATSRENVTNALATMANICLHMVEVKTFSDQQTTLFCLRAMTGAIILYDHVHEVGAFSKKSPIAMRGCITVLKNFDSPAAAGLLNALRFTSKHLNDPDTPSNIKQLLA